jgi:hypothetical protein
MIFFIKVDGKPEHSTVTGSSSSHQLSFMCEPSHAKRLLLEDGTD